MSRSKRKPWYKDRGLTTHEYWSVIRHEWKQQLNQNYYLDDFHLRNPKEILNDWDYSDYSFFVSYKEKNPEAPNYHYHMWSKESVEKYSRK